MRQYRIGFHAGASYYPAACACTIAQDRVIARKGLFRGRYDLSFAIALFSDLKDALQIHEQLIADRLDAGVPRNKERKKERVQSGS